MWTIITKTEKPRYGYVWCKCSCGVEKQVNKYHIRDNKSKSCGRCRQHNLKGNTYGKLTVIELSHTKIMDGRKHSNMWLCKCKCGRIITRTSSAILSCKSSCGNISCRFEPHLAAKRRLYDTYKKVAKNRKLQFTIPFDIFIKLTSQNCIYCQSPPVCVQKSTNNNGNYYYNGLDRLDSTKGYELENIAPCCKYCNSAKLERSVDDFKLWIKKLAMVQLTQPSWETKCWGRVWHRFTDSLLNESLLEVNQGWRCSIHWHKDRWNCFANIDAILQIDIFGDSANPPTQIETSIILNRGESITIKPGIWHCFRVLESGKLAELYWTSNGQPCMIDDIIRYDVGGQNL